MPFLNGSEVESARQGALAGVNAIAAGAASGGAVVPDGAFAAVHNYLDVMAKGLGVAVNQQVPQTNAGEAQKYRDRFFAIVAAAKTNYDAHARATFSGMVEEAARIVDALKDFSNELGSNFKALEKFYRDEHAPVTGLPPGTDFPTSVPQKDAEAHQVYLWLKKLAENMGL